MIDKKKKKKPLIDELVTKNEIKKRASIFWDEQNLEAIFPCQWMKFPYT